MFEKSVTDLIRGIRLNKKREDQYIKQAISEIQSEIQKSDLDIKSLAVAKLCVLHTMGYSMQWACFHIIEVMASSKLAHKRIGYHAASLSFQQDTQVLMLTTNLIKKDLNSNNFKDAVIAMHCLAQIVTPTLARDLHQDIIIMLNHSKPYIRKRAIIVLFRIFLKYPESLRIAFPRLKDKFDESDPTVLQSAVNVVCELARRNPKSYLPLAPQLYNLLTNSESNWIIIKIVKLFTSLLPHEPRLVKKLTGPLTDLIQNTPAISVMFECIRCVILGGMIPPEDQEESSHVSNLVSTCTVKLAALIQETDQNLKYLALSVFSQLLEVRPRAVAEYRDLIFKCLEDADISIRARSLDIIAGMVNESTIFGIVKHLLVHLASFKCNFTLNQPSEEVSDRTLVATKIIESSSRNDYENITNFEWYITVLVDLTFCAGVDVGILICDQLIDICLKVKDVRPFAVQEMNKLLLEGHLKSTYHQPINCCRVLFAAAWICGEYSLYLPDPELLITSLCDVTHLDSNTQVCYISSLFKIYCFWAQAKPSNLISKTLEWITMIEPNISSSDLEVQQISYMVIQMMKACIHLPDQTGSFLENSKSFFSLELLPIAHSSQKRVPKPPIDLESWINKPVITKIEKEPEKPLPKWDPKDETDLAYYLQDAEVENIPIDKLEIEEPIIVDEPKPINLNSVLQRPKAKKYNIQKAVELEPLEMEQKVGTTDDPFELDLQASQSQKDEPKALKPKKKKKKEKKEKKVVKEMDATTNDALKISESLHTMIFRNSDIELEYLWKIHDGKIELEFYPRTTILFEDLELEGPNISKQKGKWTCFVGSEFGPISITLLYHGLHHLITFTLPPRSYLIDNSKIENMTPAEFLEIVQQRFPSSVSTSIATEIDFATICEKMNVLDLKQVEIIPDIACTLYGMTIKMQPVVGLLKYKKTRIQVDFKGYDSAFLEHLVAIVHSIFD